MTVYVVDILGANASSRPSAHPDDPVSSALPFALVLLAGALFGIARLSKS